MRPVPAQAEWEWRHLLRILDHAHHARILEIGIYGGGTLYEWIDRADYIVAVDEQMRDRTTWLDHAADLSKHLYLVHGDSHDPAITAYVASLGQFDFIFIDADHTYDAVKADWDNYRPMLAPGGIIAFHDIVERTSYGVSRLWAEIKDSAPTVEIIEGSQPHYCGIGVIWP